MVPLLSLIGTNPGSGDVTTSSARGLRRLVFTSTTLVVTSFTFVQAQETGLPAGELPNGSQIIATHEIPEVRLVVVARGLSRPWSLAFLPGGDMLITERGGSLLDHAFFCALSATPAATCTWSRSPANAGHRLSLGMRRTSTDGVG